MADFLVDRLDGVFRHRTSARNITDGVLARPSVFSKDAVHSQNPNVAVVLRRVPRISRLGGHFQCPLEPP